MRWLITLIALAYCVGCSGGVGGSGSADNHGVGWAFDQQSAAGIKIKLANGNSLGADTVDRIYAEMVACSMREVGIAPQYVIFESGIKARFGKEGIYIPSSMTIAIDSSVSYYDASRLLRHESGHHVEYVTTGDDDPNHQSEFIFTKCSDPTIR